MKDIVTKYRAVIEDCELLLGDNDNLKNMSYNDIDEICNYVIIFSNCHLFPLRQIVIAFAACPPSGVRGLSRNTYFVTRNL